VSENRPIPFEAAASVAVAALGAENRNLHGVTVVVTERLANGTLSTTVCDWPAEQVNV
jgi:hypothetical protein